MSMTVEMVLKLIDQLTAPLKGATGAVADFGKAGADANRQLGQGIEDVQKKLDGYRDTMSKLSQMQMGFMNSARIADALGKPLDEATQKAVEFEKRIESIARAGGRLDLKNKIGADILDVAKKTNVPWQEIAKGERHLVELGGGEFLDKIAPVRERLARLSYASEAEAQSLYSLLERYMKLGKMSALEAMGALEVNYAQGKKGAYELKNMAHGMPQLFSLGRTFGMSGYQSATDLPALLQILRQTTGSAGEADTRLRHALTKLTDPRTIEKIEKELGVDVSAVRKNAIAGGQDPLFAVADAIANRLRGMPEAGKVDEKSGQIEGGDPEKLGAIARDFYFRSFLDAFSKMRDQLAEFQATPAEAKKQTDEDFASRAATAAGALERLAVAADQAAIHAGQTQLETTKSRAERKIWALDKVDEAASAAPGTTGFALSAWNTLTHAANGIMKVGEAAISGALLWQGMKYLGAKYPTLGAMGENALGVGKGIVKAPWDIAKGVGQGVADATAVEAPQIAAMGRAAVQNAGKGIVAGIIGAIGQYGIDKGLDLAGAPQPSGHAKDFSEMSVIGKIGDLLSRLSAAAVPAARAETMAPQPQAPQAAQPQVETGAMDAAVAKATEAGQQIVQALGVTAHPQVDGSSIDALIAKLREAVGLMQSLVAQGRAAAASLSRGSGALHDGYETR